MGAGHCEELSFDRSIEDIVQTINRAVRDDDARLVVKGSQEDKTRPLSQVLRIPEEE